MQQPNKLLLRSYALPEERTQVLAGGAAFQAAACQGLQVVIVDEAHHAPASSYVSILERCLPTCMLLSYCAVRIRGLCSSISSSTA